MNRLILLSIVGLAGCATAPLAPDTTIDPRGRWTVAAVNGEPTGGGERFTFTIEPPQGSARFGCNTGGGVARVDRGYLSTGDWIITTAGCHPPERMRFERMSFDITAKPMAIEARQGGIRLRNRIGSIDLAREPAPQVAPNIVGEWTAAAIDGVPVAAADRFPLTITPTTMEASLCNTLRGGFQSDGTGTVRAGFWSNTERGCFDPTGKRDPMVTEERVFAILYSPISFSSPTPDSLRITSPKGSIDFERRR